ncbi:Protein dif-1 [Trichinella pseudospiralis]|uniref:Protein dif-1 n=1 Tax=Trichinella pseudospiralis TaxID=6337 RepID=A0A0V1ENL3_TRIPS|nr:Protein dif-1 [Trichinella pseudospiralis]
MVFLFFQLFTSSDQNQHELTKPTEPKRSDYGYSLSYIYDFLGSIWQSDAKDKKICAQKNAYTTSSYVSKENIIQETLEIVRQLGNAKTVHDQLEVVNNLRHHLISFPECRTIGEMRTVTPLLIQWQRKTYGVGLREQLSECLALMGHVQPVSGNGIRLLSIDGGGTRGLMALEILEALESACAGYRIHELFDYMVGVSTGAIIVALIGGLRLNAAECRTIYELVPARLFAQSKISGSLGLVRSHSYYSTETWVTLLRQALGEKTFLQTTHRKVHPKLGLVSCVPNDGRLFPFVFRNYNHPIGLRSTFEGSCQYRLWEAVQASAAAPGYFQECRLHNLLHQDGGMIANNPTAVGIHECRHLWPNIPFQCILSIGNGSFRVNNKRCSTADYSSLRDRIAQIIESATETEMVHRTISDLLQPSTYVRLNPYMSHRYSLDESDVQRLKQMHYSHGETVKFADIIEYEEPDFENLSVGSKCLVKCGSEELWKLASVTSISLEEEQIAARLANTGVLLAVNFEHVFPLNDQSSLKTEVSQTQESLPEALPSSSSAGSARPVCRKSVDHCLQIQRNRESKDLPVEKLRVHLDDKKYEAKLAKRTEAVEKFFNMINGHLKTPDANQRKRAAEKGTTVVDISSKKSCHDLQITLLKVGEEVKQMKKRVNSLKQALRRNDGKDSVVAEDLQIKLKLAEEQLQLSLEKQARIEDEVKDRLLFFFCSANCIQINMVENDSESIDLVKQRQDTDPLRNFLAGGIGGVCCVVTGHPFDTIKVRLQTASTATGGFGPSTLSCLKKTVVDEGILALYKGMAAPVVGVAPLFALYFFGCSIGKRLQQANADEQLSIIKTFNAGALSGMMTTLIVAPGERIKCLLQVQHQHQRSEAQYAGPVDVFKKLYKEGGIRSIYRGTVATLLRDVPASGAYLATYEFLMRSMTSSDDTGELSVSKTLLAGGVAGLANWAVALPQDVLKSRLQIAPSGMYPNGMRDVARQLIREEGPLALYRGFTPVMLRAFPANAACFLGYEIAMKGLIKLGLLAVYNDYIHSRLQKHSVRVHVPIMGFQEFTGYFLIAFGTPLAIFLRVIMHDPMRIILFVGAAFFYMLSILVAAIIWFILPHFDGMLCFTVFLFVFLQEIIRYLYYQLIRRAQAGLDLVTEGNEGVEGVHPLKHANHMISFVIGMGFGSMAGIIALVNGLADSSGPGTVGLPSALKLSDMHAISVAALILLHVMWNVIIFHACDKKATWLAMFAIADHFLVTGISFYNRSNAWAASLSCLYGSLLLFSGLAYAISGGNVKNVRLFIRCIFNPRLRAQNPPDVDQRF